MDSIAGHLNEWPLVETARTRRVGYRRTSLVWFQIGRRARSKLAIAVIGEVSLSIDVLQLIEAIASYSLVAVFVQLGQHLLGTAEEILWRWPAKCAFTQVASLSWSHRATRMLCGADTLKWQTSQGKSLCDWCPLSEARAPIVGRNQV